jgi:glycosyltransferase involved in cell wall biosynthesis
MIRRPVRVLELRSVWGTGGGPDKTILLGTARTDPARYAITVCYLRDARDPGFGITAKASALGIDYVEVVERHSFDRAIWPQLRRIVREKGIQIIHAHDFKTDVLTLPLARTEGAIPLSTVHGWSGESRKERLYYIVDKLVLARYPRLIAVSGRIRQELVRYGANPARIVLVPNGIDDELFKPDSRIRATARARLGVAAGDILIGAVGRLETVKNYDLLLSAFARIVLAHPETRLVIAGDGPCREALARQIDESGIGGACILLGHRTDVAELYQAFDLFVQSSRSEGSPNAVLEAMALGAPVVATDVGGTGDLIENGVHGRLVAPNDADALRTAMLDVLRDPDAARARARQARARVERDLSFAVRMHRVEGVYDDLMASGAVVVDADGRGTR